MRHKTGRTLDIQPRQWARPCLFCRAPETRASRMLSLPTSGGGGVFRHGHERGTLACIGTGLVGQPESIDYNSDRQPNMCK